MREHVPSNTRIHYIISKGGVAANVVPDLAQIDLIARSPFDTALHDVWDWIQKIAQGAAMMTGTTMDIKGIGSYANIIPNDPLAAVAQKNLQEVGGYTLNADEKKFALELQKTFSVSNPPSLDTTNEVEPLRKFYPNAPAASTDVGDVSWHVATIGFSAATFVPGGSGAHVAGHGGCGHEHRAAGHGGCGEGDRTDRARSVHRPGAGAGGQGRFQKADCGQELLHGDSRRPEATAQLPERLRNLRFGAKAVPTHQSRSAG